MLTLVDKIVCIQVRNGSESGLTITSSDVRLQENSFACMSLRGIYLSSRIVLGLGEVSRIKRFQSKTHNQVKTLVERHETKADTTNQTRLFLMETHCFWCVLWSME